VTNLLPLGAIAEHLARVTYKPGWSLSAYQGRFEGPHLVVHAEVEDAYRPGSLTTLDVHTFLPPIDTTDSLERVLAWRLARLETHEMREWLKRDGRAIFDPHAVHADHDI
jgi:hypothetical protein